MKQCSKQTIFCFQNESQVNYVLTGKQILIVQAASLEHQPSSELRCLWIQLFILVLKNKTTFSKEHLLQIWVAIKSTFKITLVNKAYIFNNYIAHFLAKMNNTQLKISSSIFALG